MRTHLTPRLVVGLLIIALGVVFTLDHLEIADASELDRYWPVLLVVFGVAKLFSDRPSAGIFWIVAGAILLIPAFSEEIGIEDLWQYWPYLLIVIGIHVLWRAVVGPRRRRPRTASEDEAPDAVHAFGFLSSVKHSIDSHAFCGGDMTAIMGGCELDLQSARIADGVAVIDVLAFWGGVEITVPETWSVNLQVLPVMGGAEDKTRPLPGETDQQLIVKGFVLMGGVEIKN